MRKPAWFAARAKERDAEGAVEDARRWLGAGWDRRSVVLDGGLLGSRGTFGVPYRVKLNLKRNIDRSAFTSIILDSPLGIEHERQWRRLGRGRICWRGYGHRRG